VPRLKNILFVPFTFAALTAAALAPVPAWGQSADAFNQQRDIDDDMDRNADEVERNGLRGVLDPDQDTVAETAGQDRDSAEGLRDTVTSDTDTPEDNLKLARDALRRDTVRRSQRPLDLDEADKADLDQNSVDDPYAALGIRMGSFLLFPELTSETVYNDNLFLSSTNQEGDWAIELTPSLTVQSDWSRHSLIGILSGVRSYHDRFPTEDDETFSAGVAGRLDIRRTTNLAAEANYSEFFEDRSSSDFPANALERPKERTRDALLEGNHTFNRVTLTLRGELSEEDFNDAVLADGSIENNDDRDFTERRLTGRAAYEFQPGVSAFIEASSNERDFVERFDDDGGLNGSSGHDIQGGLSFKLTGKLSGEASAGYAIQTPDDTTLDDVDGLIFNAGLEWLVTGLTTLRLDASSEIEETTSAGSAGSIIRAAAISVEHRPRWEIIVGASLGYEVETFSGSSQEDKEWVVGLTGEYIFTRSVALTVGYEHLESTSSVPGSDYDVDEVRMGVRVRR
jgi:hypothetical protein